MLSIALSIIIGPKVPVKVMGTGLRRSPRRRLLLLAIYNLPNFRGGICFFWPNTYHSLSTRKSLTFNKDNDRDELRLRFAGSGSLVFPSAGSLETAYTLAVPQT